MRAAGEKNWKASLLFHENSLKLPQFSIPYHRSRSCCGHQFTITLPKSANFTITGAKFWEANHRSHYFKWQNHNHTNEKLADHGSRKTPVPPPL